MSGGALPVDALSGGQLEITLPAFRSLPPVTVQMGALKEAERRIIETKNVNVSSYNELEHVMNSAYSELKRNLSIVGYQILKTESELDKSKAVAIMDRYYGEYMKDKPSKADNASVRDAFLARDAEVNEARERLDSLKVLHTFLEGRIKVMENVCQYMRNTIKIVVRSSGPGNLY